MLFLQTDNESFECFKKWRENPTLSHDSEFISKLMNEDVVPCVTFANKQVSLCYHNARLRTWARGGAISDNTGPESKRLIQ